MKRLPNSENDEIDPRDLPIRITFVDKDYSRYTLFPILFKFSKVFLNLENKFSCNLKLKSNPYKYPVHKIANSITNLLCCGVDRFVRLDDEFASETALAKHLDLKNGFPTSDTIYRFLNKFNGFTIRQLQNINIELLSENKQFWYFDYKTVFVDIDMNTKSLEGNKIQKARMGYNNKKPGRKSLKWTIVHVSKVALYSDLHPGNTSEQTLLKQQLTKVEKLLAKLDIDFKDKEKVVLRVDGGYVSYANLIMLNDYRFIGRLRIDLSVLKEIFEGIEADTVKWKPYSQHSSYCDFGNIRFPESNELVFRVIVVRTIRRNKILYYPLCTNLFDWGTKSVVKAYRGRQVIENMFRDTNQAFYSDKLPSMKYFANKAYLWFVVLAYNQFFFFQKHVSRENIKGLRIKNFHKSFSRRLGR